MKLVVKVNDPAVIGQQQQQSGEFNPEPQMGAIRWKGAGLAQAVRA
jgi:hypothetical protein